MVSVLLVTLFAFATVATLYVLADNGLRWWSGARLLRQRMKQGYVIQGTGQRAAVFSGSSNGFGRHARPYSVIRQTVRRAA